MSYKMAITKKNCLKLPQFDLDAEVLNTENVFCKYG